MAKKSSERVMNIRKQSYDLISFVMKKDARHLIRAQALREGVTSSEAMRRAILARCGLDTMPDTTTPQYQAIKDAEIKPEAEEAIAQLQEHERKIIIKKRNLSAIRRLLSNMKEVEPDIYDEH